MSYGVDYSFSPHPAVSALTAAGAKFAGRYISPDPENDRNGKNLLPAECKALRAAGIAIILYAEQYAARMREGPAAGTADARHFDAVVKALGLPGAIMYCAADWDATPGEQAAINAYLDAVAAVIGRKRTGIYGGYHVVKRALDAGKATFAVQTVAWSGGQWDPRAHVRQSLYVRVGGVQCDVLTSMKADFGQWPRPKPAPAAPTIPASYLANGRESWRDAMHRHGCTVDVGLWWTVTKTPKLGHLQIGYLQHGNLDDPMPANMAYWVGPRPW